MAHAVIIRTGWSKLMGEDNQRYGIVNPGTGIALAPDITTAIVNGHQPQQLSAKTLMRKASRLPADWTEQRTLLGF